MTRDCLKTLSFAALQTESATVEYARLLVGRA